MFRHEISPDNDVPVFNFGKPRVDVLLAGIGFSSGENAVEERGVGLVLPVVLESVDVGADCGGHRSNMPDALVIRHRATLAASPDVIRTRTYVNGRQKCV